MRWMKVGMQPNEVADDNAQTEERLPRRATDFGEETRCILMSAARWVSRLVETKNAKFFLPSSLTIVIRLLVDLREIDQST